jgi:hypothetical protein
LIFLAVFVTTLGIRLQFTTPNRRSGVGLYGHDSRRGRPILALLYQYEKREYLRATLAFLYLFSSVGIAASPARDGPVSVA